MKQFNPYLYNVFRWNRSLRREKIICEEKNCKETFNRLQETFEYKIGLFYLVYYNTGRVKICFSFSMCLKTSHNLVYALNRCLWIFLYAGLSDDGATYMQVIEPSLRRAIQVLSTLCPHWPVHTATRHTSTNKNTQLNTMVTPLCETK